MTESPSARRVRLAGEQGAAQSSKQNREAIVFQWDNCKVQRSGGRSRTAKSLGLLLGLLLMSGCGGTMAPEEADYAVPPVSTPGPDYLIGPGDNLQIFVWRNPELTTTVPVRPDGRISVPLVEDMVAVGKTPTALARDLEGVLKQYVQEPIVNVIVTGFVGPFATQIRVVGEAAKPQAIPYRANTSLLDVMIGVGGLTRFAAGNRAIIVRKVDGKDEDLRVRLDDLLKDGDVTANVKILPGDILIIPQSYF
jgi:polysaccharide biosynthesis/export protein